MRGSDHSTRQTPRRACGWRRSTASRTRRPSARRSSCSSASGRCCGHCRALRPAVACGEARKVDRLATIRFCSARYSVPHRLVGRTVEVQATDRDLTVLFEGVPVAQHALLGPGECSIQDAHYPSPPPTGTRPLRPRTDAERRFLALGEEAESYLRAAAAQGTARLHERIEEALELAAARGTQAALAALERAGEFGRFARGDLEAICDTLGATPPTTAAAVGPLQLAGLPTVPQRSIDAYRARDGQAA